MYSAVHFAVDARCGVAIKLPRIFPRVVLRASVAKVGESVSMIIRFSGL